MSGRAERVRLIFPGMLYKIFSGNFFYMKNGLFPVNQQNGSACSRTKTLSTKPCHANCSPSLRTHSPSLQTMQNFKQIVGVILFFLSPSMCLSCVFSEIHSHLLTQTIRFSAIQNNLVWVMDRNQTDLKKWQPHLHFKGT